MTMQSLFQDIRYSLRALSKKPSFTFIAVFTLALGIGANTAIFSVVYSILFKPLPFKEPDKLVEIRTINLGDQGRDSYNVASPADFKDWHEQAQTLGIAAMRGGGQSLVLGEHPESFRGATVSANFFDVVGATPLYGRTFKGEDAVGSTSAVILSYRLFQERFNGDAAIIGKPVPTTSGSMTVIGVMPPEFKYPYFAELWTVFSNASSEMRNRANRYFIVTARLKDGQTLESASAEMKTIASRLGEAYPQSNKNLTTKLLPLRDTLFGNVQSSLFILLGAVGLVLLIACANVASLLLARAESRRREIAIRLALGAKRWHLIRQLLSESLLLALAGGALGLLLALWGLDFLLSLLPQTYSPAFQTAEVRIDSAVLLFTLSASVLTGLLFGIVPALQASRPHLNEYLKETARSSQGSRTQMTRNAFVSAQIALAVMLLIGAGLLMQSFSRLRNVNLGYNANNLLTMSISVPFSRYPNDEARARLYKQMLDKIEETPGVESVAVVSGVPFGYLAFPFNVESDPLPNGDVSVRYDSINPDYFKTLKTQLIAGREFDQHDAQNSVPVAIVNQTLARDYLNGDEAIGKQISVNYLGSRKTFQIVGIAADTRQDSLQEPAQPQIFASYQQMPWLSASFLVRPQGVRAENLKNVVQDAIWAIDKEQPASKGSPLKEVLGSLIEEPRLYATLLSIFASLALLLAAVGIYGVMSYSVAQRTKEIGIRMALGASRRAVIKLVIGQAMRLVALGVVIGSVATYLAVRLIKSLLLGVSAADPLTFFFVVALLVGVALLACFIPALRATRVDPMVALRYE